ncbi:MAG: CapA family protein [Geobacteraceae bacterium]|nr:CapA family protein [Geobacteraceae bacterium]
MMVRIITMPVLLFLMVLPAVAQSEVVIQAAGDVMLGGRWEQQMAQDGYFHPFAKIAPELKKGDITLVNLEAPLTSRGKEFTDKKYRFRVKPQAAAALKKAGITTVTLANNHSMDYGPQGLLDTLQQLDKAGIGHVGGGENLSAARKAVVYDIRGTKVALLGYSLTLPLEFWAGEKRVGTAPLMEKMVKDDIAAARKQATIVIVTAHWGEEGKIRLREYQPRLARMMIDAGADAVIGHHPHILQGIERYKRGIICYSLGNFAFAHKSKIADRTLLLRLHFDGDKRTAELLPVNILHKEVGFQATPLSGKKADEVIARVKKLPPAKLAVRKEGERWLVGF